MSDVAFWHDLGDLPEDATSEGWVVRKEAARRLHADRLVLQGRIEILNQPCQPADVQRAARLAASYLIAGDVETAMRYVAAAEASLTSAEE